MTVHFVTEIISKIRPSTPYELAKRLSQITGRRVPVQTVEAWQKKKAGDPTQINVKYLCALCRIYGKGGARFMRLLEDEFLKPSKK